MSDSQPPRFAANLKWLFAEEPLEQQLQTVAAEGFTGVEIPDPYRTPAADLHRMLTEAGLVTVLINTPQGPPGSPTAGGSACLPDQVTHFQDGIRRALEYAVELQCPHVHVVGGRIPAGLGVERARAQYVRNLAWAADQARSSGVRLLLEMQNQRSAPGFVLESQEQAAAVAQAVGEPVGLLFDVFHTQVAQGDVVHTFGQVHDLVHHVQIGDAPERSEPGTGELAWPFVIEQMRAAGYRGWFGCEFTPQGSPRGVLSRVMEVVASDR